MVENEGFVEATINSLKYPVSDIKKLLIGGLFYLVSCILLAIPAYGYATRAIRELVEGKTAMPEYNNWGRMIVDGIKVWVLMLVYVIIMMAITLIATAVMVAGFVFMDSEATIGLIIVVIGGLLVLLAVVIDIVLMVMAFLAWAVLAVTGSLLSALNPLRPLMMIIRKPIGTISLLTQMLVAIVVGALISCLVVTSPWASFLIIMSMAYQLANFYKSASA